MNHWKYQKWGDLATLEYGKSLSNYDVKSGTYRVYGTNGPIGWSDKYLCEYPSVIIGRKGAYRGVNFSQKPFFVIDTAFYLKPKIEFDMKWAYYQLLTQDINSMDSGSAIPSTSRADFYQLSVNVPPLPVQKKIAAILSSLDDKIELNTRMNNVLEETAQALFHRWFVAFEFPDAEGKPYKSAGGKMVESEMGSVPEGWRIGMLGEIANITMGQSPSGDSYNEEGKGEVFYQGRAEFGSRFPTRRLFTTEPKRMAEKGAVLMSVRAPVGDLNIATEKCCIGRGVAAIQSMDNHPSFILYTMINLKRELNVFNGEGTVFGSINKASLHAMQILIPSENIIDRFEKMVSPLDIQIETNYRAEQRLTEIRDTLLPKLMSGELNITS